MLYVVGKMVLSSIELHLIHCDILISTKVIKVLIKSMLAAIFSRWRPSATREPRGTFFPGTTHQDLSPLKNLACIKFCLGLFLYWLDYIARMLLVCVMRDNQFSTPPIIRKQPDSHHFYFSFWIRKARRFICRHQKGKNSRVTSTFLSSKMAIFRFRPKNIVPKNHVQIF